MPICGVSTVPTGGSVGVAVGASVGVSVGVAVGASVGVSVGVAVGASVGVSVGVAVGCAGSRAKRTSVDLPSSTVPFTGTAVTRRV